MKHKNSGKRSKVALRDLSESSLLHDLKDPKFAASYLEEVLDGGSMPSFLHAVRNVAIANGGMQQIAKRTKLGRESLYKALSHTGNPQFTTLHSILREVGLKFAVVPH